MPPGHNLKLSLRAVGEGGCFRHRHNFLTLNLQQTKLLSLSFDWRRLGDGGCGGIGRQKVCGEGEVSTL